LRYALRILSRNPLSAVITVVLIAAAIGLLCAAYAVLDAVVLRTLPVPHPEQLVVIKPPDFPYLIFALVIVAGANKAPY
jgi:putative ABC transport system permease protein